MGAHAVVTGPNGEGLMDLNSLVDLPRGAIPTHAWDINNAGQVIAMGIPEPETYALMLAGLGLIGFMARRKAADGLVNPQAAYGSGRTRLACLPGDRPRLLSCVALSMSRKASQTRRRVFALVHLNGLNWKFVLL